MRNCFDIEDMQDFDFGSRETIAEGMNRFLRLLCPVYGQQNLHYRSEPLACRRSLWKTVGEGLGLDAIAQVSLACHHGIFCAR